MHKKPLYKTLKIVLTLILGSVAIGSVVAYSMAETNKSNETESGRDIASPNFLTTWMLQYTSTNAPTAYDRLNDENLFGEDGWARTLYPEARSDMYFVLDWGWDLPDSRTYKGDQQDFIGTDILDPGKFPYEGDAAQRLATLNKKVTDLGWKGTGLWIYSQEPEGQRASTDGKPWNEEFWRQRLLESKEAGIALWKIDFGEYFHNSEWHRFITELANEIYPELLIERSIGGSNGALNGGTGGRERTGFADEAAYMLSYSDLYKTYDVSDHLHTAVSLERIGQILLAAYMEEGSAGGYIDSHDMPYASASLGTTIETLIANRYEVARLVAWQRDYAPAFAAGEYETKLSGETLADDWTFLRADEDWTGNPIGNVVQRAPSAIARGIDLPVATVESGDKPYLTASRNPSGAISIATHPRTHGRVKDQVIRADVTLPAGDLTGPVGIFGYYNSLTITFSDSIEGKTVYARDILSDTLIDITSQVTVKGNTITIPGSLIETIGVSGVIDEDAGAPGMFLQIGEEEDYLDAPATQPRLAVWDIPNSSFETYDSDINGAEYDELAVNPRPVNYSISNLAAFKLVEGGHTGQYAASHTASTAYSVTTTAKKYVLPKGFYTASVWVKTSGLVPGDTAKLVARDSDGQLASFDIMSLVNGSDISTWTKIELPEFFVRCELMLDITSTGAGGSALYFDDLSLTPVSFEADALISNIKVDGLSIQEYRSDVSSYSVPVLISKDEMPVVTVTGREGADITIIQTESVPGTAKIVANYGEEKKEYYIDFTMTDSVYLSDLDFAKASSGWGTVTRNYSVEGDSIKLLMSDGTTKAFEKGIGVNADSEIVLNVSDDNFVLFETYIGIQAGKPSVASAEFIILLDDEIAYRSGRMTVSTPAKHVCIDIQGAKKITLQVNSLDTIDWDVSNWADARFRVKGTIPLDSLEPVSTNGTNTVYDLSKFGSTGFLAKLSVSKAAADKTATFRVLADEICIYEETVSAADGEKNINLNIKDVSKLSLVISGEGATSASWGDASIILDSLGYNQIINGVYVDGKPINGYAFYRNDYNILLTETEVPVVTVDHRSEAQVSIIQANTFPGSATVNVTYGKESWNFCIWFLKNNDEIYLSDLQWSSAETSYDTFHRDKTVEGNTITLKVDGEEKTFLKGVGFNATAQIDVNISGMGFKTFSTYVGVEEAAGTRGTINYKVYVDGYCVYETGTMNGLSPAKHIVVDVRDGSVISLIADCVDDIIWDHGVWADAKFSTQSYQFDKWENTDTWLLSNQGNISVTATGKELKPLKYQELLTDGIDISYDIEFYSTGDVPDDAGYEFYNSESGIRIGGRIKGVHNEVSIDLIYYMPGGKWVTVYESPKWAASGKKVHTELKYNPEDETFSVIVTNDTGTLIDQTVSFPGVTADNFFCYGKGLEFTFHNDNPSQYKITNIKMGSKKELTPEDYGWESTTDKWTYWDFTDGGNFSLIDADKSYYAGENTTIWKNILENKTFNWSFDVNVGRDARAFFRFLGLEFTVAVASDGGACVPGYAGWQLPTDGYMHFVITREGSKVLVKVTPTGCTTVSWEMTPTSETAKVEIGLYNSKNNGYTIKNMVYEDQNTYSADICGSYITLNKNIDIGFLVDVSEECTNCYMVFTMDGNSYTINGYSKRDGKRCFIFKDINPAQMADEITATFYGEIRGKAISATVENYSIKKYCNSLLNTYAGDTKLVTLVSDLLVYGAASQEYIGYKTDAPVTAGLTVFPSSESDIPESKTVLKGTKNETADWYAASLSIDDTMNLRLFFDAESIEKLEVVIKQNGISYVFDEGDFMSLGEGMYYVEFSKISAYDFGNAITATFKTDNIEIGRSLSYSVNSYLYRVQDAYDETLKNLVRAIYNYGQSAKAYVTGSIVSELENSK